MGMDLNAGTCSAVINIADTVKHENLFQMCIVTGNLNSTYDDNTVQQFSLVRTSEFELA